MDFYRDGDDTLCIAPTKYIDKMLASYQHTFGELPKSSVRSPLEKGDHPELDTTELLDDDWKQKYQSFMGQLQWAVSIGRIDIATAVMTMSSFNVAPRKGHLERIQRIYAYLRNFKNSALRIRVYEPDLSSLDSIKTDWTYSVYGEGEEEAPFGAPNPLGNYVTLVHYFDANLYHNLLSGKAVTGALHFLNQTPIDWFSKKQGTPETATYGSEFVAGRTCIEQVLDLRVTLQYLGVPIRNKSYVFGDNEAMVNSSMDPFGKLTKRHVMLSFHRVRSTIAYNIVQLTHIDGKCNPADLLSKHWSHNDIWNVLQPLLFYCGDTIKLIKD